MDDPRGDWRGAAASDAFNHAIALWKRGEKRSAVTLLKELAGRTAAVDEAFTQRVLRKLLAYASRLSWREAEEVAREAIERFPRAAFAHRYLGEALLSQGSPAEARAPLERALELDPSDQDTRQLLVALRHGRPTAKRQMRLPHIWPFRQHQLDDPRRVIERFVLNGYPDRPLVRDDTVFMTLGSCFAGNLAGRLQAAGYRVHSEPIGEEINSTYANRFLLQWIEHGPTDGPTRAIDEVYGSERRERLRSALKASQVLILTLGVAPCYFELETGEFAFTSLGTETGRAHLTQRCEMRTTTVAENVANLEAVLDSAERIAGHELQVVLTVSPVPLVATVEHYSAVVADCLSKSTLRLACEEVLARRPDAVYWPSFEIVRWLGAHYSPGVPPAFGAEDRNTRHVSTWLVDLIVELFLSHHSAAEPDHALPKLGAEERAPVA